MIAVKSSRVQMGVFMLSVIGLYSIVLSNVMLKISRFTLIEVLAVILKTV